MCFYSTFVFYNIENIPLYVVYNKKKVPIFALLTMKSLFTSNIYIYEKIERPYYSTIYRFYCQQ